MHVSVKLSACPRGEERVVVYILLRLFEHADHLARRNETVPVLVDDGLHRGRQIRESQRGRDDDRSELVDDVVDRSDNVRLDLVVEVLNEGDQVADDRYGLDYREDRVEHGAQETNDEVHDLTD